MTKYSAQSEKINQLVGDNEIIAFKIDLTYKNIESLKVKTHNNVECNRNSYWFKY